MTRLPTGGAYVIASIPVAVAYNLLLDRFISGITSGAVK
jgi:multiple sugar transport system permease protein